MTEPVGARESRITNRKKGNAVRRIVPEFEIPRKSRARTKSRDFLGISKQRDIKRPKNQMSNNNTKPSFFVYRSHRHYPSRRSHLHHCSVTSAVTATVTTVAVAATVAGCRHHLHRMADARRDARFLSVERSLGLCRLTGSEFVLDGRGYNLSGGGLACCFCFRHGMRTHSRETGTVTASWCWHWARRLMRAGCAPATD